MSRDVSSVPVYDADDARMLAADALADRAANDLIGKLFDLAGRVREVSQLACVPRGAEALPAREVAAQQAVACLPLIGEMAEAVAHWKNCCEWIARNGAAKLASTAAQWRAPLEDFKVAPRRVLP